MKISLHVLACLVIFDTAAFLFLMPYCIIFLKNISVTACEIFFSLELFGGDQRA